ncbi:MAG: ABC-ATPase domain-containing protein [Actinomycetaceae bacterium]|nr:ABC-ATPase domain-containing protein [Actinomycetaceae bacterium]
MANYSRTHRPHKKFDRPSLGGGNAEQLISHLRRFDGNSYGAYKQLVGQWEYGDFTLHIDRVQSDPYAPPSAFRALVSPQNAGLPPFAFADAPARLATADYIHRQFAARVARISDLRIAFIGQSVLDRAAVTVTDQGGIELRFQCQLPAAGRRILGRKAAHLVDETMPDAVIDATDFGSAESVQDLDALQRHVQTVQDWFALQQWLISEDALAFIADGSVLARASGVDDHPLVGALETHAPETLAATVQLPYAGRVRGLVIKPGVTLIVGGGYHGKSTLLDALKVGVYPHIPEDGRELVATTGAAMAVRAEDGRAITRVDVSAFINNLPGGAQTTAFSTVDASGSTSQAAAISEAVEGGSNCLLVDEDTSATNLLIRDSRMRALVPDSAEPITPLVDKIQGMARRGISTIAVMGGSGDYLDRADTVICMDNYHITDVTAGARQIMQENPRPHLVDLDYDMPAQRTPTANLPSDRAKVRADLNIISIDKQDTDISGLEQIVESGQAETIGRVALELRKKWDGRTTLRQTVSEILDGDTIHSRSGFGARPRVIDVIAMINRSRWLTIKDNAQ